MIHQLVHETGHEADRADRLRIGHARRTENADHAERVTRPAVGREDERHVAHVVWLVLVPDEDLDATRAGDAADELAEVLPVLEGAEHAP